MKLLSLYRKYSSLIHPITGILFASAAVYTAQTSQWHKVATGASNGCGTLDPSKDEQIEHMEAISVDPRIVPLLQRLQKFQGDDFYGRVIHAVDRFLFIIGEVTERKRRVTTLICDEAVKTKADVTTLLDEWLNQFHEKDAKAYVDLEEIRDQIILRLDRHVQFIVCKCYL